MLPVFLCVAKESAWVGCFYMKYYNSPAAWQNNNKLRIWIDLDNNTHNTVIFQLICLVTGRFIDCKTVRNVFKQIV